ncbi:HK97-gp10 family putative phage morphogenesis protein [Lysinibacillus sp. NPDC097214]|uniref:HK97-gp10 family putative phage morphogenesis protein n=1 Tax=Lysinibacillus sp. NPDC097214 TaxID=3390584 RepID=UPI003CFF2327
MSITVRIESNLDTVLAELINKKELTLEAIGLFGDSEAKVRAAVLSGDLRRSVEHHVDLPESKVDIGCNKELAPYAPFVELGTSKMEAQPFLAPALQENTQKIKQIAMSIYEGG